MKRKIGTLYVGAHERAFNVAALDLDMWVGFP